jgi:hypothetical protein
LTKLIVLLELYTEAAHNSQGSISIKTFFLIAFSLLSEEVSSRVKVTQALDCRAELAWIIRISVCASATAEGAV